MQVPASNLTKARNPRTLLNVFTGFFQGYCLNFNHSFIKIHFLFDCNFWRVHAIISRIQNETEIDLKNYLEYLYINY